VRSAEDVSRVVASDAGLLGGGGAQEGYVIGGMRGAARAGVPEEVLGERGGGEQELLWQQRQREHGGEAL
jgi:hypothetical protein